MGLLAVAAFVFFVVLAPETKTYEMPSEAMLPTFEVGEEFEANLDDTSPEVGELIVFNPPAGADLGNQCGAPRNPRAACAEPTSGLSSVEFVKRVVAVGGDRLRLEAGIPIVNGESVEGDWEITPCDGAGAVCSLPEEITIPEGHYFTLGDNRPASDDSRFWGPVPQEAIIGTVDE